MFDKEAVSDPTPDPTPTPAPGPARPPTIEELDRGFCEAATRMRLEQLTCARLLTQLAERGGFHALGYGCAGEYAERRAVSADEAHAMIGCAKAIAAEPEVEAHVREGRMPVAAAACVGEALTDSSLRREGDDWLGWAQTLSTRALRRILRKRREEARAGGEPVIPVTVLVTTQVRDDFDRARTVASRKASKVLSSGETLGVIASYYLDAFDPERVEPAARRLGSTDDVPGRSIPMEERRKIFARQGERCAVPMCDHEIFLQLAHVIPHGCRGNREASNLLILCSQHHRAFDEGLIELRGTVEKPEFVDVHQRSLGLRFGVASVSVQPKVSRRLPQARSRRTARDGSKGGEGDGTAGPAPPNQAAGEGEPRDPSGPAPP